MPKLFLRKRTLLIALALAAFLSLLFFYPPIIETTKTITSKVLQSPLRAFSSIGRYLKTKKELEEENSILRKRVGELFLEREQYKELAHENKRLRELLKFKRKIGYDTVSAEVIARNPNDWIGSFIINKGTKDGVEAGSAVCSAKGLLGRVAEAGKTSSNVMLITHPAFKAGGMLKDTRIHGIVVGSGKDSIRMLYLPVDAEVEKGDVVETSGYSQIFPKGITIGHIIQVTKSKTGLYKDALLKPAASSFDQEEVLCIK